MRKLIREVAGDDPALAARRLLIERAAESALQAARDVLNPDAGRYQFIVDADGKAAERPARPKDTYQFIVDQDGQPVERDEK